MIGCKSLSLSLSLSLSANIVPKPAIIGLSRGLYVRKIDIFLIGFSF
jgi:hypothetical protein